MDVNDNNLDTQTQYVDIENGAFSLSLPDGEYMVTGIDPDRNTIVDKIIPMQVSFSVQNGLLVVNNNVTESLNLQLPGLNFTGQLFEFKQPLGNIFIYLESKLVQDHYFDFVVETDGNGNFSERLGDGIYGITGIDILNHYQYVEFYKEFEVRDGAVSIKFPLEIIYGLVQTQDESPYSGGGKLDIQDSNGDYYSADVNSNGEFFIQLPDGDYTVKGLWSDDIGYLDLEVEFFSTRWKTSGLTSYRTFLTKCNRNGQRVIRMIMMCEC